MGKSFRIILFSFLFIFLLAKETFATCSVNISPAEVQRSSSRDVIFTVTNSGDNAISFVKIPTGFNQNISVTNVTASGWDLSLVSGGFGMVYGSIAVGSSVDFTVSSNFGSELGSVDWFLEASEQADGSNSFTCDTVSMNVVVEASVPVGEITPTPTPVPAPSISNIAVSATDTSAVLTWSLNSAASGVIYYGKTSSYGSNVNTGSEGYEKATLTGLTPSTTYHFQIQIIGVGGTTVVADNTFTTAAAGAVSTVTTTVTNIVTNTVVSTVTQTNTNTVTKIIGDGTPPVVTINKIDKEVWSSPPVISGTGVDNRGVARVEYRVGQPGDAWQLVTLNSLVGSKKMDWEFLPGISLDGTYKIEVRAVDIFGNKSLIKEIKLVIDQIPPTIGGGTIKQGGLYLSAENGRVKLLEKAKTEVMLYELGGSESVVLHIGEKHVSFQKIVGSNAWMAVFDLAEGSYSSFVVAKDGAGKETTRKWLDFQVLPMGKILNGNNKLKGEVRIFWRDPISRAFEPWFAKNYGQKNVELVNSDTGFGWIVPKGEYYLRFESSDDRVYSPVIKMDNLGIISSSWQVGSSHWWSKFWSRGANFDLLSESYTDSEETLTIKNLGDELVGNSKLVLFINPDMPGSMESLIFSQNEAKKTGRELVVIGILATKERLDGWMNNVDVKRISDEKGEWIEKANINVLPTLFTLDGFGNVEKVKEGIY